MDNQNEVSQQPVIKPPEPKHPPLLSKSTIILIAAILIAFAILYVGIYSSLNTRVNQPIQPQTATPTPITAPSPAPNGKMANWKTYTNSKYGYSIAFPKEQFVRIDCPKKEFWLEPNTPSFHNQEIVDGEIHIEDEECNRNFINHMELNTFPKSLYKPPQSDEIFSVTKESGKIGTMSILKYKIVAKSRTMDDGRKTLETEDENQIVIEKGNNVYVFTYDKPAWADWESMANQILSTFRFLPASPTGEDQSQCVEPRTIPKKPIQTKILSEYYHDRFTVKFVEGSGIRLRDGKLVSLTGTDIKELNAVLAKYSVRIERTVSQPEEELDKDKARIEAKSGTCLADLNLYYRLYINPKQDIEKLIDQLNALPIVEIAYPEGKPPPPPQD